MSYIDVWLCSESYTMDREENETQFRFLVGRNGMFGFLFHLSFLRTYAYLSKNESYPREKQKDPR